MNLRMNKKGLKSCKGGQPFVCVILIKSKEKDAVKFAAGLERS